MIINKRGISMNNFDLHKPLPYYLQFYEKIKQMIVNGEYKPGQRINETQLAKAFGVSRSPIREAMRLLEKDGLLVADQKTGFIVYSLSPEDVEEIYQIRTALESLAIELCITRASDEELLFIEQLLDRTAEEIKQGAEDSRLIELNEHFHQLILQYSHNKHLKKQLDSVNVLIYFCRVLNFKGKGRAAEILDEHQQVFTFIKKRSLKAVEHMQKHLHHDLVYLQKRLNTKRD